MRIRARGMSEWRRKRPTPKRPSQPRRSVRRPQRTRQQSELGDLFERKTQEELQDLDDDEGGVDSEDDVDEEFDPAKEVRWKSMVAPAPGAHSIQCEINSNSMMLPYLKFGNL